MSDPDDGRLDALVRSAAPNGAIPGFAERVVAAARARRRGRRAWRLALGAAAVVVSAVGFGIYIRSPEPDPRAAEVTRPAELKGVSAPPVEGPADEETSFAIVLPPTARPRPRVMMARINGTTVLFARPPGRRADAPTGKIRSPRLMAGSVSPDPAGPSFAIRFR